MNIQNQINLILTYLQANEYRQACRVEISNNDCAYVFVKAQNPTYYTIHSIWQHDEFEMFTDDEIEEALQHGTALSMLATANNCPAS